MAFLLPKTAKTQTWNFWNLKWINPDQAKFGSSNISGGAAYF
jgi:hypothetical protein